jgi:predicted O-linked N-acetylglucosamine transferase (SPINDLY family)
MPAGAGSFTPGLPPPRQASATLSMTDQHIVGYPERTLLDRAISLHNEGRVREAIALYQQLHEAEAGNFDAVHLMGVAALQLGELALARRLIEAAIALRPGSAEAHNNLGSVCTALGDTEGALQSYLAALHHRPSYAEAFANLGNVLLSLDRTDEARACFEETARLAPGSVPAASGLGRLQFRAHDLATAQDVLGQGLIDNPGSPELLLNQALVLIDRGLPDLALPLLDRLPGAGDGNAAAVDIRRIALARMQPDAMERDRLYHGGRIDEAEAMARRDLAGANTVDHHNFLLKCYLASPRHSARDYFDESRAWAARHAAEERLPGPDAFPNERDPDRRLRVGLVGDYIDSMIGRQTLYPFFRQYDRRKIELHCYNFGGGGPAIASLVDHYQAVHELDAAGFFDRVRADRIDILLDINGRLRTPNFFDAMLRQPAPVQVNWFNLTATVGVRAYNYLIADDYSVPAADADLYVEKIFNMPNGTISAWDMGAPPVPTPPPMERNGHPTFSCFGDFFKVNGEVMQAWARLLHRVKDAKLYLKSANLRMPDERTRVAEAFHALGIDGERLILEGPSPYEAMKRLYSRVDVAIDTFPYSSGSTSINALWQGVPVVAIGGDEWRSRNTASILAGAGLTRYIARDIDDYIDRAQALAGDIDLLRQERAALPGYLAGAPQWDTAAFAVNFEARLRAIWRDWLAGAG